MTGPRHTKAGEPGLARWLPVSVTGLLFFLSHLTSGFVTIWLTTALAASVGLALAWWLCREVLALLKPRARDAAGGLAVGLLMILATHGVYAAAVSLHPPLRHEVELLYASLRKPPGPVAALPVLLLVVLAEEVVWRGVLYNRLASRLRSATSILVCSAAYALPQLAAASPWLVAVAFGCGLVWTAQRAWTGSLVAPLVTHLVWDIAIFVALPLRP